jgi:DNA repair exonuclease SbcCD nuclease subunit
MTSEELRVVVFSDIHLGHPNTTTVEILAALNHAFPDNPTFGEIDIIWIAGDVFDRLLHLPDPNVIEIRLWINRFLRLCQKHDVVLRVLEGTPSHDWKQSRLWTHLNELAKIGADVKYIEALTIEWIERFGIHVLYLPDEWNPEADDSWIEIQQLLKSQNLEQVDFTIMHGMFEHQLPPGAHIPTHDSARYLALTRYFVFVGHIHHHSIHHRILAPGSFDRLAHGEERPKGHLEVVARKKGNHSIVFVENKLAKLYVTLKCRGTDVQKTLAFLEKRLNVLPPNSFVRIEAVKADPILASIDILKKGFPFIRFSIKVAGHAEIATQTLIDLRSCYQPIVLTPLNLKGLLLERLEKQGVKTELLRRADEVLDGYC